jgi:NAD(P)-dependent dehydrogenase (short-subunit alcohol dehydrogenase family)
VLVTGAAGGIGRRVAEQLVDDGRTVVVTDRTMESLGDVMASISAQGGCAHAFAADISDREQVEHLVADATAAAGLIDGLVNNAAFLPPASGTEDVDILSTDDWVWDAALAVNVKGTANVTRAVLPGMLAAGQGSIVNVVSILGLHPLPGQAIAYSVSKAASAMLARHVAVTYGSRGVRCNAVAPGSILTHQQLERFDEAELDRKLQHYPSTRLGDADDVAASVSFLMGNGAAFINGQVLAVDGGVASQLVL